MRDTAIRKRLLEARIEARDRQLQLAAMQFDCGTWTLEPNTGELHCSARALALLGLAADAQPDFTALQALAHPGDRQQLAKAFAHALTVRDQFEVEFALSAEGTAGRKLRCLGCSHASALDADRFALSGILVPVDHETGSLITLDAEQLAAMVLRLDDLLGMERSALAERLQSEVIPQLQQLQQKPGDPASTSALLDLLRTIIFECQPPGVSELGFHGAVERCAVETAATAGLQLSLSLPAEPLPLGDVALDALYQAARAGMNNVAMHARATRMSVRVGCSATTVTLEIGDDGTGIATADMARGALGLFASSARLAACAGRLRIGNRPGGGTLLQVTIDSTPARRFTHGAERSDHAA